MQKKNYIVPEIIVETVEGEIPLLALPDSFHVDPGHIIKRLMPNDDCVPVFWCFLTRHFGTMALYGVKNLLHIIDKFKEQPEKALFFVR